MCVCVCGEAVPTSSMYYILYAHDVFIGVVFIAWYSLNYIDLHTSNASAGSKTRIKSKDKKTTSKKKNTGNICRLGKQFDLDGLNVGYADQLKTSLLGDWEQYESYLKKSGLLPSVENRVFCDV